MDVSELAYSLIYLNGGGPEADEIEGPGGVKKEEEAEGEEGEALKLHEVAAALGLLLLRPRERVPAHQPETRQKPARLQILRLQDVGQNGLPLLSHERQLLLPVLDLQSLLKKPHAEKPRFPQAALQQRTLLSEQV